ncbi:MAG: matrixin family metalloprotease [Patescibacteria group bacterium]|nr:matrixin family metalloprotease [Patescibacteria group bacterium]
MKKVIAGILLLIVVLVAVSDLKLTSLDNLFTFSYCDQPIHYRVDTVDPQFDLSRETFLSDIDQASGIWNTAEGKNLFVYDPQGDLSINLTYDERQSLTNQVNQLEDKVQIDKQSLNPKFEEYQRLSAELKQKLDNLNKEVEDWNNKGGAPPDEYQRLVKEQQDLKVEADKLNAMARDLNISANNYNSQVDELNQTVDSLNNALEQRPEEGIFKGPENRIEIYFNNNKPELVHTLAHELGHALGIKHVSNPAAIMYPKTSQKLAISNDDLLELKEVCKRRSVFEILQARISQILNSMQINFNLP